MKNANAYETRYINTDGVSIPVVRCFRKWEAYRMVTVPGWGVCDNDVNTQKLFCVGDTSATVYSRDGSVFSVVDGDEINLKDVPNQSDVIAIVVSDSCGFTIWMDHSEGIKIFITFDQYGYIDNYRFGSMGDKPFDDEVELYFSNLSVSELK